MENIEGKECSMRIHLLSSACQAHVGPPKGGLAEETLDLGWADISLPCNAL